MQKLIFLVSFILILVAIPQVNAETNTIIIKPMMDTFIIDNFNPGETSLEIQNFGELPFLKMHHKKIPEEHIHIGTFVFLKFDLFDLRARYIEEVKLIMTPYETITRDDGTILNAYEGTTKWNEHELTFSTRPHISYETTIGSLVTEQDKQIIWDITDIAQDKADNYLGIVIGFKHGFDGVDETIIFYSRETENPDNAPYLEITYSDDVPEIYLKPNVAKTPILKIKPTDDAFLVADFNAIADDPLRNIKTGDYEYLKIWYSKDTTENNENIISYAYLKFDISELSSKKFQSVNLKMNPYIIDINSTSFPVDVHLISDVSWNESDINYNNSPSFSRNQITSTDVETQNKWYSWDVTDAIKENIAEQSITLAVLPLSVHDGYVEQVVFHSKDTQLLGLEPYLEVELASEGGGCLIATATFGTELAPQVQQLREIRDYILQTNSGSAFMNSFNNFYYSFSPYIADYERENPVFKEAVKIMITPMISSLSILNYADIDSEAEMVSYGISIIMLNLGMYVGIPAMLVHTARKLYS